jgi:hypothetical protein
MDVADFVTFGAASYVTEATVKAVHGVHEAAESPLGNVSDWGKFGKALMSGASLQNVGMGAAFGAFR